MLDPVLLITGATVPLPKSKYAYDPLPAYVNELQAICKNPADVLPTFPVYPVSKVIDLPEAFNNLEIPNFIQIDPKKINKNKEKWIDEWLNAS